MIQKMKKIYIFFYRNDFMESCNSRAAIFSFLFFCCCFLLLYTFVYCACCLSDMYIFCLFSICLVICDETFNDSFIHVVVEWALTFLLKKVNENG